MRFFNKVIDFIKESQQELSKVIWLSKKDVFKYTIFVIIAVGVSTLIVAAFDIFLIKIVQIFITR